jgi:hypothetical protein
MAALGLNKKARLEIPFHIIVRVPEGQRYRYEEQESRTQEKHKSGRGV